MANHESAAKRARQRFGRTARNRLVQGALRSSLKKARVAIGAGKDAASVEAAKALVAAAARTASRAASKGVLHRNAAARLNSRLQRALNKLTASG